jgi:hypothetical protein
MDKPKMTKAETAKAVLTLIGSIIVIYFTGKALLWW